jgi:hypothetical protein
LQNINDADKINNINGCLIYGSLSLYEKLDNCKNGYMLLASDYFTFKSIIFNLMRSLTISEYSTIKGEQHDGRGFRFSEKDSVRNNLNFPNNTLNELSKYWFYECVYSSWCKISKELYGNLNYFFSPNIPFDKYVNTMLIASITCHRSHPPVYSCDTKIVSNKTYLPEINCLDIKNSWSKLDSPFVTFDEILPTKVATVGLRRFKSKNTLYYTQPIYIHSNISEELSALIQSKTIIRRESLTFLDNITHLALLDVSPENLVLRETFKQQEILRNINL